MVTVGEFVRKIQNTDRLQIIQQNKRIYVGYCGALLFEKDEFKNIQDKEMKKFRVIPEIRHKRWKEQNLMRPLEPDATPEFSFSDLEMKLYYVIYI